ncbi:hypothetical protein BJX62DRAFT_231450 [Aspergillus germanicus]
MVNYGVSRACETCRRRRKKRSYEELHFRHHTFETPSPPTGESEQSSDKHVISSFLDQYVVHSANPRVSRGFLSGLPSLLVNAQSSSHVMLAIQIAQYVSLLHSFQAVLESFQLREPTIEALMTGILLVLYEIISIHENFPGQEQEHIAHVRGVCSLMLRPNSPFDLLSSTQLFQVANPLLIKHGLCLKSPFTATPGVLCASTSNNSVHDLDSILIQCHPLFERANSQLQDPLTPPHQLQQTFAHALEIEDAFAYWNFHKDASWEPVVTGYISQEHPGRAPSSPFSWPGPVHSYFDLYVAAVINTYRKTYLMLLDVVIRLLPRTVLDLNTGAALEPNFNIDQVTPATGVATNAIVTWTKKASGLVDDILASIPYHLANDLSAWPSHITNISTGRRPPMGGLLLFHPLYVLSSCTIVPPSVQMHVRKCLAWIGEHMGIGQATVMSKLCQYPIPGDGRGHVLTWAGILLQPTKCGNRVTDLNSR